LFSFQQSQIDVRVAEQLGYRHVYDTEPSVSRKQVGWGGNSASTTIMKLHLKQILGIPDVKKTNTPQCKEGSLQLFFRS